MSSRWQLYIPCLGILFALGGSGVAEAQLTANFRAEAIDYDAAVDDCDVCVFCTPTCELYFAMGVWAAGVQQGPTSFFPGSCTSYEHEDGVLDFSDHLISESLPDLSSSASFYFGLHDEDPGIDINDDDLLGTHYVTRSTPASGRWDNNNNTKAAGFSPLACDGGSLDLDSLSGRFELRYSVWFTDATAPSTPGTPVHSDDSANSGWDDDTTLAFSWSSSSDPHSGVSTYQVQLQEDTVTVATTNVDTVSITVCDSGCTVSRSVTEGSVYRLRVRARNGDSIDLSPQSWSSFSAWSGDVMVDFTPPSTTISSPSADSWQKDDFEVAFVDSAATTCQYQVVSDGSGPASEGWVTRTCSGTVNVSAGPSAADCDLEGAAAENVCHLYARAIDAAGLVGVTADRAFGIDYTGDRVSVVSALTDPVGDPIVGGMWTSDTDPYFFWSAPTSTAPIAGYSWALDSGVDCAVDTSDTFVNLSGNPVANGIHEFAVRSVDAAGNCSTGRTFDLRVDATSDAVQDLSAYTDFEGTPIAPGEEQGDDTPYMEWSASTSISPVAGYSYGVGEIEDCIVDTGDTFVFLGPLGGGSHLFWVRAIDSAQNCGSSSTFEIVVVDCPVLELTGETVSGPGSTEEQGCAITVGPDYIVGSTGRLTLRFGTVVTFVDGFSVDAGGELSVIPDPDLVP